MTGPGTCLTIVFVLLSYSADAPAGVERSLASLQEGLRRLGHRAIIVTAPSLAADNDPDLLPLTSVTVAHPATEQDLLDALGDGRQTGDELRQLLIREGADIVCWADASWGLGYLAPAPPTVRTALTTAVMRTDPLFRQALGRRPDVVITRSAYMMAEAAAAGYDTSIWRAVPNALLLPGQPPDTQQREHLRSSGPIRIVARAEPQKGILELIQAVPADLDRPLDIVLAAAGFEYWPGMQADVIASCRQAANQSSADVRILPAMPWSQVPGFFAGACATLICTTSPESWCNAAAEALSAGTPVLGYNFGNVPDLVGTAGVMVEPAAPGAPATALWEATLRFLADPSSYHQASQQAPGRVLTHTPRAVAQAFLKALAH